ncbi:MAG: hypothetical protein KIT79_09675 [Deltaproteobacteria bacterium]|nr:hypothetical protein [Deltaproteobacteria bacterium]
MLSERTSKLIEGWARTSYDSFRIQQPQIVVDGLWKHGDRFLIYCPSLASEATSRSGKPIREWFDQECRAITCPVAIVPRLPIGARRLADRTIAEIGRLTGEPITRAVLQNEIDLQVPDSFPDYYTESGPGSVTIHVSRELSPEEQACLSQYLESQGGDFKIMVETPERVSAAMEDESRAEQNISNILPKHDLILLPARKLPKNLPGNVKDTYETDQEFWLDHRDRIWSDPTFSVNDVLPPTWNESSSKGFVDASVFPASDIRNYLSLYDVTCIAPPLDRVVSKDDGLGLGEDELVELMKLGRVRLVFPQSLDRYSPSLLAKAAAIAPQGILFSRRLAAASICDVRRRVPLLYPAFDITEKRKVIQFLDVLATNAASPHGKKLWKAFGDGLIESWHGPEYSIHLRGAVGTLSFGFGTIIARVQQEFTGRDLRLEMWSFGSAVEWAGALGAALNAPPSNANGYDQAPLMELLAHSYSGVVSDAVPVFSTEPNVIVPELLTISKAVPAVEFATSFMSSDINRFRSLVKNMAGAVVTPKELHAVVEKYNASISAYDKNMERWSRWGMKGLVYGGALAAAGPSGPAWGLFLDWLIEVIENHFGEKRIEVPPLDSILDYCKVIMGLSERGAVLVSRMRNDLNKKHELTRSA